MREPAAVRLAEDQPLALREPAATVAIAEPLCPLRVGGGGALLRRAGGAAAGEGEQSQQGTAGVASNVQDVGFLAADLGQDRFAGGNTHGREGEGTGEKERMSSGVRLRVLYHLVHICIHRTIFYIFAYILD